jgi:hypothetical protein
VVIPKAANRSAEGISSHSPVLGVAIEEALIMGAKRGKGVQAQNSANRKSNASSHANMELDSMFSKQQKEQQRLDRQMNELQEIWDEFQGPTTPRLFSSWKEIASVGMFLLALGMLSVIVGLAAGMTISIHYFEDPLHRFDNQGMVINGQHKVTTYDNDILTKNLMPNSSSIDLGRVEKTIIRGERMVVSITRDEDWLGPLVESVAGETFRDIFYAKSPTKPTLCPDGKTMGFSNWEVLTTAIHETNALSAEKSQRWREYFSSIKSHEFGAFQDDALYYEDESVFTICPGVTLKGRRPIFVNAENSVIECDACTFDVAGTHFAFGPQARNVLVRGVAFKWTYPSSLVFNHDGAEVTFEDCLWITSSRKSKSGTVADLNSFRYGF